MILNKNEKIKTVNLSICFIVNNPFDCLNFQQGCSIVVLALANTDDLSGYVSSLEVHDKWLVQSSAVGATIFLLIIVVSYFLGESQSRRTVSSKF